MNHLWTILRSNTFARDTAILTLGSGVAQSFGVLATPLLSRLYSPESFGVVAIFSAVSGIVATITTLKYETGILLPKNDKESIQLISLCILLIAVSGSLLAFLGWSMPLSIKKYLAISALGDWLPTAIILGMGIALITVGNVWLNRNRAYIKMAKVKIVQSVISVASGVILGIYGFAHGLILAQIVSTLIIAILLVRLMPSHVWQFKIQPLKRIAKNHRNNPKYLLPAALLDVLSMQLPVLLIAAWYSTRDAGQFSMAWRVLMLPAVLIGNAIGQVFLQKLSVTWPDKKTAKKQLYQTWLILAGIGLIPLITITIFGESVFAFVLGNTWRQAGQIAVAIAWMIYAIFISSPTSGTYIVLGLQKYGLIFSASSLIYRPAAIAIGIYKESLIESLYILSFFEIIQIVLYHRFAWKKI